MSNYHIEKCLENWDFDAALEWYKYSSANDAEQIPNYCRYLADTGHLDVAKSLIDSMKSNPFLHQKLLNDENFSVCRNLNTFFNTKLNEYSGNPDYFCKLYMFSLTENIDKVFSLLTTYRGNNINHSISAENNMILNFALNKLIRNNILNVDISREIIIHLANSNKINIQRKRYLVKSIVDFISKNHELSSEFFDLKHVYTIHIRLIPLIYAISNEKNGAKLLMSKVYTLIQSNNNLNILNTQKRRIAICISGMFKSDLTNLRTIQNKLAEPLNADIFIHTWDRQQDWMGDVRRYNFWPRVFNISNSLVPKNLQNLSFLEKNYSNIYSCLLSSSFSPLDITKIKNNISTENIFIENENDFIRENNISDSFKSRETFNQVKMFYGLYKCFELAKNKEDKEGFQYDYFIRLRADTVVNSNSISPEHLDNLDNNSLAVPAGAGWGISDGFFYSNRSVYERVVSLWKNMLIANRLSPFEEFKDWDAHKLLGLWLLKNDIRPVPCKFSCGTIFGGQTLKVPGLLIALEKDNTKKNQKEFPEETQWLMEFLQDKAK